MAREGDHLSGPPRPRYSENHGNSSCVRQRCQRCADRHEISRPTRFAEQRKRDWLSETCRVAADDALDRLVTERLHDIHQHHWCYRRFSSVSANLPWCGGGPGQARMLEARKAPGGRDLIEIKDEARAAEPPGGVAPSPCPDRLGRISPIAAKQALPDRPLLLEDVLPARHTGTLATILVTV